MMRIRSVGEAIRNMNRYGTDKVPYLFFVDYDARRAVVEPLETLAAEEMLYDIRGFASNVGDVPFKPSDGALTCSPMTYETYVGKFETVRTALLHGDSFLANLTVETPVKFRDALSLRDVFMQVDAPYRIWWREKLCCFSPECFVEISPDGVIATHPMKGTIRADMPHAAERILADAKESAEHFTVVDLLRNDLSMVATEVRVERLRYLTEIHAKPYDLLQVSSKITGRLPRDFRSRLGDIIFRMLPAGSVTGAPKPATVRMLRRAEGYERGWYCGVFGVFDGERLKSAVAIRFLEQTVNGYVYKSGGGITARSDVRMEYQEVIDKIYIPLSAAAQTGKG